MDFYNKAARSIDQLDNKQGSLKSIVFNLAGSTNNSRPKQNPSPAIVARQISDGKRLLRVVAETLRYRQVIETILQKIDILQQERKIFGRASPSPRPATGSNHHPRPESLVLVLVHDQLFSSRGISLAKVHKIRQAIERHAIPLRAELTRLMVRQGVSQASELLGSSSCPSANTDQSGGRADDKCPSPGVRWMRVNTIKWTITEAVAGLIQAGWKKVPLKTLTELPTTTGQVFAQDDHLSCLLALPSTVILATLPPYLDGRLIAQDKASCIPAQLLLGDLAFADGVQIIDATAAPGNKTTMLSAIVGKRGKVWAFEKDPARFRTLKEMSSRAGCTNVECIHGDFLSIKPSDRRFSAVSHILVDPSCSGSGISNRLDHLTAPPSSKRDDNRVQALSRFQTTIVSHALRFPSVTQVAYSTCSVYREENEEVVLRILNKPEMVSQHWTLKDPQTAFPKGHPWTRTGEARSEDEKPLTDRMVKFDPALDHTIGFFAVVFMRNPKSIGQKITPQSVLPSCKTRCPVKVDRLSTQEKSDRPTQDFKTHSRQSWKGIRPGKLIYS